MKRRELSIQPCNHLNQSFLLNKLQSMKCQLCIWEMRTAFFVKKNDGRYVNILKGTDLL